MDQEGREVRRFLINVYKRLFIHDFIRLAALNFVRFPCPAVAVIDGRAEDLGGVKGRRGREADFDGVEVLQQSPVLGDVIVEAAETELDVGEISVEQVTVVAFVDDDAVVPVDRRRGHVLSRIEGTLDHALHGGDMDGDAIIGDEYCDAIFI